MLNDFVKEIVTQYSFSASEGIIDWNLRTKLTVADFKIIQNAFDLSEQRLSYLDCTGDDCYAEVEVKTKRDGSKYVQCYECRKFDLIDDDQDLAHKITLDGVANFLINLMKIRSNKKPIEYNNIIYLGQSNVAENLILNVYLVRRKESKESLLKYLDLISDKTPVLVIQLYNEHWYDVDSSVLQVGFAKLVSYDEKLEKFIASNESFSDQINDYLAKKAALMGVIAIQKNNRKYAAGGKKKAEENFGDAKNYVLNEYQKLKRKNSSKKDVARIISKNFPSKTFPVIPTEDTIYRYILAATKSVK
jgi:hypothetical protein